MEQDARPCGLSVTLQPYFHVFPLNGALIAQTVVICPSLPVASDDGAFFSAHGGRHNPGFSVGLAAAHR